MSRWEITVLFYERGLPNQILAQRMQEHCAQGWEPFEIRESFSNVEAAVWFKREIPPPSIEHMKLEGDALTKYAWGLDAYEALEQVEMRGTCETLEGARTLHARHSIPRNPAAKLYRIDVALVEVPQ